MNTSDNKHPTSINTSTNDRYRTVLYAAAVLAALLGLYASSIYSYILFHSLVEITTIAIAFTLFILTWHTRRFLASGCLKALGIGYGLIAVIDLLHTLAYKGMGVFPEYGANLPTQLWIAARSLQAVLLLAAPMFAKRDISESTIFTAILTAVSVTTVIVFSGVFPDCFVEGKGLTQFKIISEYVISAFLIVSLLLFIRSRAAFSYRIFRLIVLSIICTIGSELAFTSYISVYGPANMAGHFLKLAAFGLVYRALVVIGLKEPFELIFRDLKQTEQKLIREKEFGRSLLESMADGVVACDADGILTLFNRTAREWHGLDPMQLPKEEWAGHYDLFRADGVTPLPTTEIPLAMAFNGEPVKDIGMAIVAGGREPRFILANGSMITGAEGRKLGAVVVMRDVTTLQRLERELRKSNEELERRVLERTLELQGANSQLKIELEERAKVESSLKLARFAMDSAADAIVWLDQNGAYFYANRAASGLLGYGIEELLKMKASDVNPDHRNAAWKDHWDNLRKHGMLRFEAELTRKDGRRVQVDISANYIEFDDKEYNCAFIRDTSEQKRAEESIRQSEQFLNSVIENIPDMIFVKGAEELRFVRLNNAGEQLLGYPREQLLGRNDYDFFPKEEADFFTSKDREVLDRKALVDIPEEPIKTREKGERLLHTKKIPILDKNGVPRYLLGISEDITDRKHSEDAYRASVARFSDLFNKTAIPLCFVDKESGAIDFNAEFKKTFGYSKNEIPTLNEWWQLAYPDPAYRQEVVDICKEAFKLAEEKGTDIQPLEYRVSCKDGKVLTMVVFGSFIGNELLLTFFDVTERERAEEKLLRMNEELEMRVKERTAELEEKNEELERMNRLFVGRELRMVELKERVRELQKQSPDQETDEQ